MIYPKKTISRKQISLVLADLVILAVVPFITLYIYFFIKVGFGFKFQYLRFEHFYYFSNILIFIIIFYVMDLHNFKKNFATKKEVLHILLAICFAWVLSIFFFYITGNPPLGRGISIIYLTSLFVLIVCCRLIYNRLAVSGFYTKKAIIVGAGKGGEAVAKLINANPQLNIHIMCMLEIDKQKEDYYLCEVPVVCEGGSLIESVSKYRPDLIILAMRRGRYEKMIKDIVLLGQRGIEIQDITSIYEEVAGKIPLKYVSDSWILFSHMNKPNFYFNRVKRLLDIASSSILLILASPIMLLTVLAIRLDSAGPIFYRQLRVGKDGKGFDLIKFRSMVKDAEKESGPVWVNERDHRITRVGKIIRLLRIDELPQLLNVLKGEMSFVGPRPERPEFVSNFLGKNGDDKEVIPHYGERLTIKPGLTGWAQVMFPYAASYKESIEKLEYDLYYIKNMSFILDLSIILKTIRVVLFGYGAR